MTRKHTPPAPLRLWLAEPLPDDVAQALWRLRRSRDVRHVAVMPDVHLAHDVCVGTVLATTHLLYPAAVGGDIGCGMAAIACDCRADLLAARSAAEALLEGLHRAVPIIRRHQALAWPWLERTHLSDPALEKLTQRDGRVELGTLGRGNHFLEFQEDLDDGRLWLMVHSGSRGMGPAIRDHHLAHADGSCLGLRYLAADGPAGRAYLHDAGWARGYAEGNRRLILRAVDDLMQGLFGVRLLWATFRRCDHNHVQRERHFGQLLWVHRKGAMPAARGRAGIIPGSMGAASYHVVGKGHAPALNSSAHGAGRALSRERALRVISPAEFRRQMEGVWIDPRSATHLRDEAPSAYKDIDAVMRAQRELVRVERRLRPVLAYKG